MVIYLSYYQHKGTWKPDSRPTVVHYGISEAHPKSASSVVKRAWTESCNDVSMSSIFCRLEWKIISFSLRYMVIPMDMLWFYLKANTHGTPVNAIATQIITKIIGFLFVLHFRRRLLCYSFLNLAIKRGADVLLFSYGHSKYQLEAYVFKEHLNSHFTSAQQVPESEYGHLVVTFPAFSTENKRI